MAYKAFSETQINSRPLAERENLSLSKDSACADHVHFLTGVRSLGKLDIFRSGTLPAFNQSDAREIKYEWNFDNEVLAGQSLTTNLTTGVFLSSADQFYKSSTNDNAVHSNQSIFRFVQGYLYRNDNDYQSISALQSSSSADMKISVVREINLRNDIYHSSIQPASFKLQINSGATSLTASIDGPSSNVKYTTIADGIFGPETPNVSAYTSALDLNNPLGGGEDTGKKSFFGVDVSSTLANPFDRDNGMGYTAGESLDSVQKACTIEAIIRPMKSNSIIYFRRLATSQNTLTRNKFMKLEITQSPDQTETAFRFYIRNMENSGDFSEDFSKENVQTSGLFVPGDVGINLFDGNFHHIAVSWDAYEIVGTPTAPGGFANDSAERGAGVVMGYIDGYKLTNKEEVFPRLSGADAAGGPSIQANMVDQRIPIRQTKLFEGDIDHVEYLKNAPSGNNVYIGTSNFNRLDGVRTGDVGALVDETDAQLDGMYDGQIAHVRIWNQRLKDGTTAFKDGVGSLINLNPTDAESNGYNPLGLSFSNFKNTALTSASAINIASWWYFNNINGITGFDMAGGLTAAPGSTAMEPDRVGNISSNTGSVVGNATIKMLDSRDFTLGTSGNTITDLQVSGVARDFLYMDQPQINNPIDNDITQGRVVRKTIEDDMKRVGLTYYDLGLATLDGNDENARLNFVFPASGVTGDFGFAATGHNNASFNVQRLAFNSQTDRGRLLVDAVASGTEMNFAGNPTGIDPDTGGSIFDDPASYITSVGLYNHKNELLAIAKLSQPTRKDEATTLQGQVKLDF